MTCRLQHCQRWSSWRLQLPRCRELISHCSPFWVALRLFRRRTLRPRQRPPLRQALRVQTAATDNREQQAQQYVH